MNTVTSNALAQLNLDKQKEVEQLAQAKIAIIMKERALIASYQESIKLHQEHIAKIVSYTITDAMVFGRPASTTPSMNEVTILNAIAEMNKSKQKAVEAQSKDHMAAIDSYNQSIATCEERIGKYREELNALSADMVTAVQVLG